MKKLISCWFNLDSARVELKYSDGTMLAIDTIAVENEVCDTMNQRSDLDWLLDNKPLEYAQLVPGGDLEGYLKGTPEHRLMDKLPKPALTEFSLCRCCRLSERN